MEKENEDSEEVERAERKKAGPGRKPAAKASGDGSAPAVGRKRRASGAAGGPASKKRGSAAATPTPPPEGAD